METDYIKDALKLMPYGFYSITSRNGDDVNAMVANWVMQASFSPRLVVIALQKKAYSHDIISQGGVFAVNIFHNEDEEAIKGFTSSRAKNPEKMSDADYTPAPETGCPILSGAAAYLECRVVKMVDVGGDHDILVGEVVGAEVMKEMSVQDTLTLPHVGWSYAG